jgi:hypothetical protein
MILPSPSQLAFQILDDVLNDGLVAVLFAAAEVKVALLLAPTPHTP